MTQDDELIKRALMEYSHALRRDLREPALRDDIRDGIRNDIRRCLDLAYGEETRRSARTPLRAALETLRSRIGFAEDEGPDGAGWRSVDLVDAWRVVDSFLANKPS